MGEKSVNYDGHTRPLISIQVTELIDGVFIGFTMNHCVADGTSFWHFISTLSEIFGRIKDEGVNEDEKKSLEFSISREPICDTLFPSDVSSECPIYKLPYLEPEEFITRYDPGPLRVRLFRFSYKSISLLTAQSNKECGLDNSISSFQALIGFIWRSITRARNLQPDDEARTRIVMNARTLFDPPYPPEYFRCFITGTEAVSKVGDLMSNGVGRAAMLVNKSVKMHDKTALLGLIKYLEEHPCVIPPGSKSPFYKPNGLTIGGSSRFDTYGPEFGLGRAVAVLAGYASREDGKVTAYPGREGGGSVDLEVCLKPETMNALELDEDFMRFCY